MLRRMIGFGLVAALVTMLGMRKEKAKKVVKTAMDEETCQCKC